MESLSVNYVIAAWSGPRRGKARPTRTYEKYFTDMTFYLRFHINRVLKIKKHISHITIVAPFNYGEEPKEFSAYLDSMPEEIDGVGVTVLRRENVGISFGSFSYAFEQLGPEWDYYIFNEDDHIPVHKSFDEELVNALLKSKSGCVCAWKRGDKQYSEKPVIGHP